MSKKISKTVSEKVSKVSQNILNKYSSMVVTEVNLCSKIKTIMVADNTINALEFLAEETGLSVGKIIDDAIIGAGIVKVYEEYLSLLEQEKEKNDVKKVKVIEVEEDNIKSSFEEINEFKSPLNVN